MAGGESKLVSDRFLLKGLTLSARHVASELGSITCKSRLLCPLQRKIRLLYNIHSKVIPRGHGRSCFTRKMIPLALSLLNWAVDLR